MSKKTIMFNLVQSNINGGLENMYLDYSKILAKNCEVVCIISKNFVHIEELKKQKIKYEILNIRGHFDFFAMLKFAFLVKQYKPKLIFAHNGRCFALLNLYNVFCRKRLFKIIAVSHGGNPKRLINFDYIITVAKHLKAKIIKKYPHIKQDKIKVIYNGIIVKREVNNIKTGAKNKQPIFGVLARLSKEKNIITAIKAFELFAREVKNAKLLIAGEGPEAEYLKHYVTQNNLDNQVFFLGHQKEIKYFFEQIDVLVHPTKREAFGLVILEAFYNNKFVISSNVGGLIEIIKHEYNGFLYEDPESFSALKKAMLSYHQLDSEYKQKIIKHASQSLKRNFSLEILENKLTSFVKEISLNN